MNKEKIKEFWDKFNIFLANKIVPFVVDATCICLAIRIGIIQNNVWSALGYFIVVNLIVAISTSIYIATHLVEVDMSDLKNVIKQLSVYLCPYFLLISIMMYYIWVN